MIVDSDTLNLLTVNVSGAADEGANGGFIGEAKGLTAEKTVIVEIKSFGDFHATVSGKGNNGILMGSALYATV